MTPSRDARVADYLAALDHPMKPVILAVREALLAADHRVVESLKWSNLAFGGPALFAKFVPAKAHLSVIFLRGTEIAEDPAGLLGGDHNKAYRGVKYASAGEVDADALGALARQALALE